MVGTVEPRKGHLQVLDALEELWSVGVDINLVIVGAEGWRHLPDEMRRTIPYIVHRLRSHRERNTRLFWIEAASDEYLEEIFAASSCVIAASEGEGFGLPLIEAVRHRRPVIARDLAVFREAAGDKAMYYHGDHRDLVATIQNFLVREIVEPPFDAIFRSWRDAAAQIASCIIGHEWYYFLVNDSIRIKALDEHLDLIHRARIELIRRHLPKADIIFDLGGANTSFYQMGYQHSFERLYMIDLPPNVRHDMYKEIVFEKASPLGKVVIHYGDMTDLSGFADESVDLVWSGQSIAHVPPEGGEKMCRAAFRVLKRGGAFCLDTPNRILTRIHTRSIGGGSIHPEHFIEYEPETLRRLLERTGFVIYSSLGIREMPNTLRLDEFWYEDFLYGRSIISDVERGYIQYLHCVKP